MKKLQQWLFWQLIALLSFVALAIVFQGQLSSVLSRTQAKAYQNSSTVQMVKNKKEKVSYDYSKVKSANLMDLLQAQISNQNYPVIGLITIPDLGIDLPVFQGVTADNMLYGAATLKEGQEMGQGNYALASHHITGFYGYDASQLLFTPLERAKEGQEIFLTDKKKVYVYTISNITVTNTLKLSVIENHAKEKEITLITCQAYESTARIVVTGKLSRILDYE